MSLETAQKVIVPQKKNYVPKFLKQRDINSYLHLEKSGLATTCKVKKIEAPSKCPDKMAHKVSVPPKKIMSQSFLNSGTLVILCLFATWALNYVPQFIKLN